MPHALPLWHWIQNGQDVPASLKQLGHQHRKDTKIGESEWKLEKFSYSLDESSHGTELVYSAVGTGWGSPSMLVSRFFTSLPPSPLGRAPSYPFMADGASLTLLFFFMGLLWELCFLSSSTWKKEPLQGSTTEVVLAHKWPGWW